MVTEDKRNLTTDTGNNCRILGEVTTVLAHWGDEQNDGIRWLVVSVKNDVGDFSVMYSDDMGNTMADMESRDVDL